jgi:hypothetical protein
VSGPASERKLHIVFVLDLEPGRIFLPALFFFEANLSYPFEGTGVNSAVHPQRLLDRRRWRSFFQSSRSFHYVFTFPLESRLNFAFTPTQFGLRNNILAV